MAQEYKHTVAKCPWIVAAIHGNTSTCFLLLHFNNKIIKKQKR